MREILETIVDGNAVLLFRTAARILARCVLWVTEDPGTDSVALHQWKAHIELTCAIVLAIGILRVLWTMHAYLWRRMRFVV